MLKTENYKKNRLYLYKLIHLGMDELQLFLEGIENKIKRLIIKQKSLLEEIEGLKAEKGEKDRLIADQSRRIEDLEKKIEVVGSAKALNSEDNTIVRHKIDEILRDIDECLVLLNK